MDPGLPLQKKESREKNAGATQRWRFEQKALSRPFEETHSEVALVFKELDRGYTTAFLPNKGSVGASLRCRRMRLETISGYVILQSEDSRLRLLLTTVESSRVKRRREFPRQRAPCGSHVRRTGDIPGLSLEAGLRRSLGISALSGEKKSFCFASQKSPTSSSRLSAGERAKAGLRNWRSFAVLRLSAAFWKELCLEAFVESRRSGLCRLRCHVPCGRG